MRYAVASLARGRQSIVVTLVLGLDRRVVVPDVACPAVAGSAGVKGGDRAVGAALARRAALEDVADEPDVGGVAGVGGERLARRRAAVGAIAHTDRIGNEEVSLDEIVL